MDRSEDKAARYQREVDHIKKMHEQEKAQLALSLTSDHPDVQKQLRELQTQKWMISLAQQQVQQQSAQMSQQMQKLNHERIQVASLMQEKQQVQMLKNDLSHQKRRLNEMEKLSSIRLLQKATSIVGQAGLLNKDGKPPLALPAPANPGASSSLLRAIGGLQHSQLGGHQHHAHINHPPSPFGNTGSNSSGGQQPIVSPPSNSPSPYNSQPQQSASAYASHLNAASMPNVPNLPSHSGLGGMPNLANLANLGGLHSNGGGLGQSSALRMPHSAQSHSGLASGLGGRPGRFAPASAAPGRFTPIQGSHPRIS